MIGDKLRIVALVPLRGGSKGIKKKNIKLIAGKPLCEWGLNGALQSKYIDDVYVSTDSEEIKSVVTSISSKIKIIDRPKKLALDETSTEDVLTHFSSLVDFDILITIQVTSPLTTCLDLDAAINQYIDNKCDSMVTVVRSKRFLWTDKGEPVNYIPRHRPRRQDFDGVLVENGAFYITSQKILLEENCRLGGNICVYEMNEETFYEIDEPADWEIVQMLLEKKYRGVNG